MNTFKTEHYKKFKQDEPNMQDTWCLTAMNNYIRPAYPYREGWGPSASWSRFGLDFEWREQLTTTHPSHVHVHVTTNGFTWRVIVIFKVFVSQAK